MTTRWLFGDQLGPHFVDDHRGPLLMVESTGVFRRRRFHRAKAHLVLSAMRHRAADLGGRLTYVQVGTYAEVVREVAERDEVEVLHPTSYAALGLVERLGATVLPPRGFATARDDFERWAEGRGGKRLLMEDFYRRARLAHGVLVDGAEPAGGRWNFDHDNREPAPKGASTLGVTEPWWPTEDDIDAEVREDLDRWERDLGIETIGRDGPRRFAATRREALAALEHFVEHRLPDFGAHEDAILEGDDWMAHSLVSAPMNLGLLDPLEVVERAEAAYRSGAAPIASVEGFVRQVIGWRDYVWHLYWHQGDDYRRENALRATEPMPQWFAELDGAATDARCLSHTLDKVAEHGWVHHIPRLMVLGSYALQRGWAPRRSPTGSTGPSSTATTG
jgi:deoxyribodipyrimidine photolyase-related protein